MSERVFVLNALRTPFGKFGGILKDFTSVDLATVLLKELLHRTSLSSDLINELHLGCCIHCTENDAASPIISRQVLLEAGLSETTISTTIDKACCSSTGAIHVGVRAIKSREADIVVAGGVEVMSRIPHLLRDLRWGKKIGSVTLEDPIYRVEYKKYNPVSVDAGEVALEFGVSREEQDEWAYLSQMRYQEAYKNGRFEDEVIPVQITDRKGNIKIFDKDEFPKSHTTLDGLAKLKTVYGSPTVTPGNAPGLNDGAAMMILIGESKLKELGLEPLAEILTVSCIADKPRYLATVPAHAINNALEKIELNIDDINLIEINEAFAAMPLVSSEILSGFNKEKTKELRNKININGGAIAIGHPVGASGARILMTLIYELKRRGGGYGVSAICGGLAQGDAVLVKV